jgi:hypothetical protein
LKILQIQTGIPCKNRLPYSRERALQNTSNDLSVSSTPFVQLENRKVENRKGNPTDVVASTNALRTSAGVQAFFPKSKEPSTLLTNLLSMKTGDENYI